MKRIHLIISGDVQGVGFRSWVKSAAEKSGLSGWVKNREDRTVELMAEGEEFNLGELVRLCRRGPEVAWVTDVQVKWEEARGEFTNFSIQL